LLDHFKPFAVLAVRRPTIEYCSNSGVKSTEMCGPLFRWEKGKRRRHKMSTDIDKRDGRQLETDYKSRTQKKKEDRALQRLGEQLVALPSGQLETIALPDELRTAVEFARKISKHGARRRQIKYIGALMRHFDSQSIQIALDRIRSANLRQ
jgi:ribosomal 50S subunit-associated protein YjgA (DUF615 family)